MREILFRGKDKDGHWHNDVDAYVRQKFNNNAALVDLVTKTVGQYTGLNDQNGVKIFEDDIVEINKCDNHRRVVVWADKYLGFALASKSGKEADHDLYNNPDLYAVVGNIHDNPELLTVGADHD